jgi:hypothetical protein
MHPAPPGFSLLNYLLTQVRVEKLDGRNWQQSYQQAFMFARHARNAGETSNDDHVLL